MESRYGTRLLCGVTPAAAGPRSGAGVRGTWFLWRYCSSWGIKTAYPIQPQDIVISL